MKNLKPLLAALVLSTVAVAQTAASDLYAQARTAHGASALSNLKTLATTSTLTFSGGTLTQIAKFDFERGLYRLEVQRGGVVGQVFRLSPTEAKSWSSQGTRTLDAATTANLRFSLLEGVLAFRRAVPTGTTLSTAGTVQIAGQSGTGLTLASAEQTVAFALSSDGTVLAQRFTAAGREVQLKFSDYRVTNGLKFAYREQLEGGGAPVSTLVFDAVTVNPVLTDADFALPQ